MAQARGPFVRNEANFHYYADPEIGVPGGRVRQTKPKDSGQSSVDGGQSYKRTQFPAWQQRAECAKQDACVKSPRAGLRSVFLGQYRRSVWPIPTLGGRVKRSRIPPPGRGNGAVRGTHPAEWGLCRACCTNEANSPRGAGDAVRATLGRLCETNPICWQRA